MKRTDFEMWEHFDTDTQDVNSSKHFHPKWVEVFSDRIKLTLEIDYMYPFCCYVP